MFVVLPATYAGHGPCGSQAWLMAPKCHSTSFTSHTFDKAQQHSAFGSCSTICSRSFLTVLSGTPSRTNTRWCAAAVGPLFDGDGAQIAPVNEGSDPSSLSPLPLDGVSGSMATTDIGKASRRRPSWKEKFASLLNDATDPWSASTRSFHEEGRGWGSGNAIASTRAPTESFATPKAEDAVIATAREIINGGAAAAPNIPPARAPAPAPLVSESVPLEAGVVGEIEKSVASPPKPPEARVAPSSSPPGPPEVSRVDEAAEVMESRGESDAAAAYRAYLLLDAELASTASAADALTAQGMTSSLSPVSVLSRSTAAALLSWIRCATAGNGLVVVDDGQIATSDTEERQKLWAEHAPRVLQLVADIGKDPSSDPELQQMYTEAVMYSVSSQGIVKAFLTGNALAFTSAMAVLVKNFPTHDNGVAHIFYGSYYLAAPWPIGSPKKGLECYEKALKINERSRRNVYYTGLGRLACGDRGGAREMFARAASDEDCESASATERDIAVSLREQAQRGLEACQ